MKQPTMTKTVKKKRDSCRTEPICAYSMFLKLEKQKVGSTPLNVTEIKLRWSSMTLDQKDPYIKLSKEDKESLGPNYRKNRRKGKSKPVQKDESSIKKRKNKKKEEREVVKDDSAIPDPSLTSMLGDIQSVDEEITRKNVIKLSLNKDLMQLKLNIEVKVRELDVLDTTIANFTKKCHVLNKNMDK